MGVSGSGKTSVGLYLSRIFSIPFYDADDFHNDLNIQKMKKGYSLINLDRMPWLKLLSSKIKEWNSKGDLILACSALKESYRKILSNNNEITFIFLDGSYDLIYDSWDTVYESEASLVIQRYSPYGFVGAKIYKTNINKFNLLH